MFGLTYEPHVRAIREPATSDGIDPVILLLECPDCRCTYIRSPIEQVLAADGTFRCPHCDKVSPLNDESFHRVTQLYKAIRAKDHSAYMAAIVDINCATEFHKDMLKLVESIEYKYGYTRMLV